MREINKQTKQNFTSWSQENYQTHNIKQMGNFIGIGLILVAVGTGIFLIKYRKRNFTDRNMEMRHDRKQKKTESRRNMNNLTVIFSKEQRKENRQARNAQRKQKGGDFNETLCHQQLMKDPVVQTTMTANRVTNPTTSGKSSTRNHIKFPPHHVNKKTFEPKIRLFLKSRKSITKTNRENTRTDILRNIEVMLGSDIKE